jgi:hypothetical protein
VPFVVKKGSASDRLQRERQRPHPDRAFHLSRRKFGEKSSATLAFSETTSFERRTKHRQAYIRWRLLRPS